MISNNHITGKSQSDSLDTVSQTHVNDNSTKNPALPLATEYVLNNSTSSASRSVLVPHDIPNNINFSVSFDPQSASERLLSSFKRARPSDSIEKEREAKKLKIEPEKKVHCYTTSTRILSDAASSLDPINQIVCHIRAGEDPFITSEDGKNFYDICESRNLWKEDYESFALLMEKIYDHDHSIFEKIITDFNIKQEYKNYLLISAVKQQNVDMTRFLIENGADINHRIADYPKKYWNTLNSPFATALKLENKELFDLLLQAGASIRQEVIQDVYSKKKPLHYLAKYMLSSEHVKNLEFESYMLENIRNMLTQEEKAYIFKSCLKINDWRAVEILISVMELSTDDLEFFYNKSKGKDWNYEWFHLDLFLILIKYNLSWGSWDFDLEDFETNILSHLVDDCCSLGKMFELNDLKELLYEDNSNRAYNILLSLLRKSQKEIANPTSDVFSDDLSEKYLPMIEKYLQTLQQAFTLHQSRVDRLHEEQLC